VPRWIVTRGGIRRREDTARDINEMRQLGHGQGIEPVNPKGRTVSLSKELESRAAYPPRQKSGCIANLSAHLSGREMPAHVTGHTIQTVWLGRHRSRQASLLAHALSPGSG
jgi:hypothetical protein